jgi:hypothetical protein
MSTSYATPSAVTNFALISGNGFILYNGYITYPLDDESNITPAHGYFSNGVFTFGQPDLRRGYYSQGSDIIPIYTLDASSYYIFPLSGETPIKANGYFSNGYFQEGVKYSVNQLTPTPTYIYQSTNIVLVYYIYRSGTPSLADGPFSNGAFLNGRPYNVNIKTPISAINNNSYYTYTSGNAVLANGYYTNGYFINGTKITGASGTTLTPVTAIDGLSGVNYYYVLGTPFKVNDGAYSYGFYFNSKRVTNYTNLTPQNLIDRPTNIFYSFLSGNPFPSTGFYTNGYFLSGTKQTLSAVKDLSGYYYDFAVQPPRIANGIYPYLTGGGRYVNGSTFASSNITTPASAIGGKFVLVYSNNVYTAGNYTLSGDLTLINTLTSNLNMPLIDGKIGFYDNGIYTKGVKMNMLSSSNLKIVAHAVTSLSGTNLNPYVYGIYLGKTTATYMPGKVSLSSIYAETSGDVILLKNGPLYIHGDGDVYKKGTVSLLR